MLKILLLVILNQNRHLIENEVDKYQSGFIKGKGTREGIFKYENYCREVFTGE